MVFRSAACLSWLALWPRSTLADQRNRWDRRGALSTPRGGILEGITRQTVFEIAAELAIPAAARDLTPYDLYTADEAFLCSTAGGIFPVVVVDGRQVGGGRLGSLTHRVRERYWERHLHGPDVTPVLA
jgi:branched-chain amino acid aminotransferase